VKHLGNLGDASRRMMEIHVLGRALPATQVFSVQGFRVQDRSSSLWIKGGAHTIEKSARFPHRSDEGKH
jgi:hypothetical protein